MKVQTKAVALVGRLGHGKTYLLNKLTGTAFPSTMSPRSCTDHLQYGYTRTKDILVIDTPGFYSSEDVAKHIAAQKMALEGVRLSGVYVVAKFGRADDIAEEVSVSICNCTGDQTPCSHTVTTLQKIMSFVGDDDLRVIITHADTVERQDGYSPEALRSALSSLLNLPIAHIAVFGKDSSANDLELFLESTLHNPKSFTVTEEQITSISSLHAINRKLNKPIEEAFSKIAAASKACQEMVKNGSSYEADVAIQTTQSATTDMVAKEKNKIFRNTEEQELTTNQKNLVYGKAGLALSLRLKNFIDSSNKLLSWDVTDPFDLRNVYKKCNHCGAVFNKTEGCDGATVCGAVPRDVKRPRPRLLAQFHQAGTTWTVQYFWDGTEILIQYVPTQLKELYTRHTTCFGGGVNHIKRDGAAIESGCGAEICWNTMLPVDRELIQLLGEVEIQRAGPRELASKDLFDDNLSSSTEVNRGILQDALS